jgi:hypothetical protein
MAKGKEKARLGCMVPGDGDEPAKFIEGGRAAGPKLFDAGGICDEMGLWWKSGAGNTFVLGNETRGFSVWPEQAVTDKMRMERCIQIKSREGEFLPESKQVFLFARENRCLDEIFPALPGYRSGVYRLESGERVLVKTSPTLPVPAEGSWDTIRGLIEGQLDRSASLDIDQTPWFYSWCKIADSALRSGEPGQWRQGHALILTGPAGGGKSRLQENLITPMLGGRAADPKKFLFDQDEFNGDVFAAEHLSLGEVPSSQKTVDRTALAETIKQIVANSAQRMRLMRTEPWTVHPYWRLSISLNDDPDKLRSLPLITNDFGDKVLIFHTCQAELPMPTRTDEERKAFRDALREELPAFIWWLQNVWEIPTDLLTYKNGRDATRFGFREFHHPVIKSGLFDDTPAAELMQMIDMAVFTADGIERKLWDLPSHPDATPGTWYERAATLEAILTGNAEWTSSVAPKAKQLFQHNKVTSLLGRLKLTEGIGGVRLEHQPNREWKGWMICRPPKDHAI